MLAGDSDYLVHVLFDEAAIAARVEEIAREILAAQPRELLVIAILRGSFIFAADLVRALHRAGLAPIGPRRDTPAG